MVAVDGRAVARVSLRVHATDPITVADSGPQWVGRAALKLHDALDAWSPPIEVAGRRCLDVGASTGGFTQVLLAHDAARVVALDVGHDQLAAAVREDPRVEERSGTSVRDVTPELLGGTFDIVVTDLSFISLTLTLPHIAPLLHEAGHLVALVKPQFEVGRSGLGKRGVVTDPEARTRALRRVVDAAGHAGVFVHGIRRSPIDGGSGNIEYLLWGRRTPQGKMDDAAVTSAVTELGGQP